MKEKTFKKEIEFLPQALIPLILQPVVVDLWYIKQWTLLDKKLKQKVYTIRFQRTIELSGTIALVYCRTFKVAKWKN